MRNPSRSATRELEQNWSIRVELNPSSIEGCVVLEVNTERIVPRHLHDPSTDRAITGDSLIVLYHQVREWIGDEEDEPVRPIDDFGSIVLGEPHRFYLKRSLAE